MRKVIRNLCITSKIKTLEGILKLDMFIELSTMRNKTKAKGMFKFPLALRSASDMNLVIMRRCLRCLNLIKSKGSLYTALTLPTMMIRST